MKKTTMKDIAEAASVSITTVSKILNNVDMHISESTRKKVLDLANELNYVPNQMAKGLRSNSSSTIGVVTYDISDPYVSEIVRGIETICKKNGISILITNTNTEKSSAVEELKFLTSKMVDGIIFLSSLSNKNSEWLSRIKMPVIVVDHELDLAMSDVGMIDSDSMIGVYKATSLLIQNNCKKIAYLGPSSDTRSSARIKGYLRALNENEQKIEKEMIYQAGRFDAETGIAGIEKLFGNQKIDGVVCANDLIAAGALLTLHKKGISVPEEVKVIGMDNISISQYLIPPLTTVDLHGFKVGNECAEMLISRIRDKTPLAKKLIDCKVVMRESV